MAGDNVLRRVGGVVRVCWVGGQKKKMLTPRSGNIDRGGQKFIGRFGFLVLDLRFSDHVHRTLPSRDDIDTLMNRVGPIQEIIPAGSHHNHFLRGSYGRCDISLVVTDWITLPNTHKYYVEGNYGNRTRFSEAIQFGLDSLEADVTFGYRYSAHNVTVGTSKEYIGISVFYSGYAAEWGGTDCVTGEGVIERVWSHKRGVNWK